eukprot:gene26836-biopygen17425
MLWFRRAATRLMLGTNWDDKADIYRSAVRDLKKLIADIQVPLE